MEEEVEDLPVTVMVSRKIEIENQKIEDFQMIEETVLNKCIVEVTEILIRGMSDMVIEVTGEEEVIEEDEEEEEIEAVVVVIVMGMAVTEEHHSKEEKKRVQKKT